MSNVRASVLWTMDCEAVVDQSSEGGPPDWDFARRSIAAFCEILDSRGFSPTLFVVPTVAVRLAGMLRDLATAGIEVGLHCHPQDLGFGDYLGGLDRDDQRSVLVLSRDMWSDALGSSPASFRSGNFSGNDHTFPLLSEMGIRWTSTVCPGRTFTRLRANWAGAPETPYRPSAANRLVAGDLNLVEVPLSVDRESIMWGGLTPLELRVEMVDARAHGYTMRKLLDARLATDQPPVLVAMTHNIFDFSEPAEFRRSVLVEMIDELRRWSESRRVPIEGPNLARYAADFADAPGASTGVMQ